MTTIIGYSVYGIEYFQSPSPAVRNIKYAEIKNGIVDELHIREQTSNIDTSQTKDSWQIDTRLLAKFLNDLEAGNISNQGLQITQFAIKRREISDLNSTTLQYMDFINNSTLTYKDYTQASGLNFVYSVVPIAENDLEGLPNEVNITSDFSGWFIVDKDTNNILSFDKFIGSEPTINLQLNQGRTVIETFNQYPSVFYNEKQYHTFSLNTIIIPSEFEKLGKSYTDILNNFIYSHKPFLVKNGSGNIYICDVSNPRLSSPLNTWKDYDYGVLTLDFMEIDSVENYMNGL